MDAQNVRVRFAPSPTGPLHMGGVRTALFNYLFARKHNGSFILRIEDTDQVRFVPGAEEYIIESLQWCGLYYDEGPDIGGPHAPYRQSERSAIYRQYAERLVKAGWAYYAFDTPEELDQKRKEAESHGKSFSYDAVTRQYMKNSLSFPDHKVQELLAAGAPHVVRFKMPSDEEIVMHDLIRGEIRVKTSTLDDKVLFKADGLPTYHLANVVDDFLMRITHVIRGEEWLPSLPLHVMLYRGLGWEDKMPQFAHLPLILKPNGQGKLSKRDGDKMGFPVFPLQWKDPETGEVSMGYREQGYFSQAFVNMLALLGWNPGTEQELFTLEELVHAFSLERVNKSGARFDPEKARWFNQQYLRKMPVPELVQFFLPVLQSKGIQADGKMAERIVETVRDRAVFVHDLWDHSWFFFQRPDAYDQTIVKKRWSNQMPEWLNSLTAQLEKLPSFTASGIKQAIHDFAEKNSVPAGNLMNCLRLCLVGSSMGPDLALICEILGPEETKQRIERAVAFIGDGVH